MQRQRIGVFGGTFDPIHIGHLIIAEILQYELDLQRVVFLPAGRPPHKPSRILASDHDRIEMLRLAIRRTPSFSVSMVDLERPGYSYTSRSLEILHDYFDPGTELIFLMGQDSLRDFPNWHRPDLIAQQAQLGVAQRPGVETSVADIEKQVPETAGRIHLVPVPLIGISSTDVRRRIRRGEPFRYQVSPLVADYIDEQKLYIDESPANQAPRGNQPKLTAQQEQPYTRYPVVEPQG